MVKNNLCLEENSMSEAEKYEELRKYFESAEDREQGYIVVITRLKMENKELKRKLAKAGVK